MSDHGSSNGLPATAAIRKANETDALRKFKARERQRRKRAKDRENAGLPAVPARDQRNVSATPSRGPNKDGETEEAKKARIREAARLRQQKHRQAVRMRRQQELDNPQPLPHEVYYGQDLIQMYDGPGDAGPSPYAPSGAVFANTLILALGCEPNLKFNLMRLYSIAEEEFPSLEQAFCQAFDHWNHSRYAASHAAHYGQMPHGPPPEPPTDNGPPDEARDPSKYSEDGSVDRHAAPPSPNVSSNIDARLRPGASAAEGPNAVPHDGPSRANGAVPSAWPALIPGGPGMPQTIYSANGPPVALDAHGQPIPASASQGYFLSHNPEPPHFRRHRGARNGEGSPGGSVVEGEGSPPRGGEANDGDEDMDEHEEENGHQIVDGRREVEGQPAQQQQEMLDPGQEHHKFWHALMQARMEAENRAQQRAAAMMHPASQ